MVGAGGGAPQRRPLTDLWAPCRRAQTASVNDGTLIRSPPSGPLNEGSEVERDPDDPGQKDLKPLANSTSDRAHGRLKCAALGECTGLRGPGGRPHGDGRIGTERDRLRPPGGPCGRRFGTRHSFNGGPGGQPIRGLRGWSDPAPGAGPGGAQSGWGPCSAGIGSRSKAPPWRGCVDPRYPFAPTAFRSPTSVATGGCGRGPVSREKAPPDRHAGAGVGASWAPASTRLPFGHGERSGVTHV